MNMTYKTMVFCKIVEIIACSETSLKNSKTNMFRELKLLYVELKALDMGADIFKKNQNWTDKDGEPPAFVEMYNLAKPKQILVLHWFQKRIAATTYLV